MPRNSRGFHPWGWLALSAGVVVSIVGTLSVTGLLALGHTDSSGDPSRPSAESGPSISPSPSDPTPADAPEPTETSQENASAGQVDEIVVTAELSRGVKVGSKVAPNTYRLVEWGDSPAVFISYRWEARSNGITVEGEDCGMSSRVTGPESTSGMRSAKCDKGYASQFNGDGSNLQLHTPGTYVISVHDSVSGAAGEAKFEIVR